MDIKNVDLNLLVLLDTMMERRSVTRAAEALGLSQPATSAALARLRLVFGDPLFVKVGSAMQPTPRTLKLAAPVRRVIAAIQEDILQPSAFNPAQSDKTFSLIAPDIAEVILLPSLLQSLCVQAPGVKLRVSSMPRLVAAQALESGQAELALGYFPDLQKAGFFQQRLFKHRYVGIVRESHPFVGSRLTMKAYLSAPHAVVAPEGREHAIERFLNLKKLKRNVVLELSHFMSLSSIIARSDLLATVPDDLANLFVEQGGVRTVELPVAVPRVEVHQFWHQRMHKDAANVWLRGLVNTTLTDKTPR